MIRVAICGASGYTGAELLRLLASHPKVRVTALTADKSVGQRPTDLYPQLHAYSHLQFEALEPAKLLKKADLFFLALPHAASQEAVAYFYKKGKKVIDLSADFRLRNHLLYERWYGTPHHKLDVLKEAVYGLPELHRKQIKGTRLVANPGCYPTSAILGLMPVLRAGLGDLNTLVIDSKSGTSGAGRKADVAFSYCEVNEGFKAYGVATHRHTPEIEQELSQVADHPVTVNFTPHLLPVDRGILSTMYLRLAKRADLDMVRGLYAKAYAKEPFVHLLPSGSYPNLLHVRGTNNCHIGVTINERTSTIIIVSAIDNLIKGASGQAVQNMNIICGFKETTALEAMALCP